MPELPEVETVKCGLDAAMRGRTVREVVLRRGDLRFAFPQDFANRISGQRIEHLGRRAKYILIALSSGETLIVHLGMSGHFSVFRSDGASRSLGEFYYLSATQDRAEGPHDHVVFMLDNGTRIVYTDPRRFGFMDLAQAGALDAHKMLARLGAEPLGNSLNAGYLAERFANKTAPLKAALLDQQIIAGLGNIYVCEALNRSRLSPRRQAGTLVRGSKPDPRLERLVTEIRAVLHEAIAAGGSTLRDHALPDGTSGAYQQRFRAYDRAGRPCANEGCKGIVRRIIQSGRSTFYCPRCQR